MARGPASHHPELLPSPSSSTLWRVGPTVTLSFFFLLWPRSSRALTRHSSSFNGIDARQFLACSGRYKKASLSSVFPPRKYLNIIMKQLAAKLAMLQTPTSFDGDCGEL
jgi:hypothetical protein